jgi:SAM-dependent methyltransferase
MKPEREYVLGTDDDEVRRLGLQHCVWRPKVLDAWQRAGFTIGQVIVDVGCGPGYATLDLADIVGPQGRIFALERSRRFLDVLKAKLRDRRCENVEPLELDLDMDDPPVHGADGAWCRWVLSFVKNPRKVLAAVAAALRLGGVFVSHEYCHYSTWRIAPRSTEFEEFVTAVMASWRAEGGEPDIGLCIPGWLGELGFKIRSIRPMIEAASPGGFLWEWPKSFVGVGTRRLVALGHLTAERAAAIVQAFTDREASAGAMMLTPALLEIIAVRE